MECLDSIASACEGDFELDLNELINQWYDWVQEEVFDSAFPQPPFTAIEAKCLSDVQQCMSRFCDVTPQRLSDTANELKRPEWLALRSAAQTALKEMTNLGNLPEDSELEQMNVP